MLLCIGVSIAVSCLCWISWTDNMIKLLVGFLFISMFVCPRVLALVLQHHVGVATRRVGLVGLGLHCL